MVPFLHIVASWHLHTDLSARRPSTFLLCNMHFDCEVNLLLHMLLACSDLMPTSPFPGLVVVLRCGHLQQCLHLCLTVLQGALS